MKGIATLLILSLLPLSAFTQTTKPQTAPKPTATPAPKTQTIKPSPTPTPKTTVAKPAPTPTPKTVKPSTNPKNAKAKPTPTPTPRDPKIELDKALAYKDPEERLVAFQDYLAYFPTSPDVRRIKELMVSARGEIADKLLQDGEKEDGIEMFKTAVLEAPAPVSDELFSKVILKFPAAVFAREERAAAFEVAASIEQLAGKNPKQLLGVATFYLSVQYGTEAIRIAKKAIETAPDLPLAYYTLGAATRLNFRLDESAAAYAKALELEPTSVSARRNLADIKRATGKPEEAEKLYREIVEKDPADQAAHSSLALCLFDLGKREDAEAEMAKALEAEPGDVKLLSGAAFWYAANGAPEKAIELGQKAQRAEPAYTWGYIAEARGHLALKKPLDAERVLLIARATGNFPTLNYEIAAARYAAGLYREAVDILATSFEFKDGLVSTYLGNRVLADSESMTDLLALERKGTVLEAKVSDDAAAAAGLKGLLEFSTALSKEGGSDEAEALKGAERFIGDKDNMQPHRQLFVASRLLTNKTAVAKAAEYTKAAVPGLDESLKVATPGAAVLADELYEARISAFSRGEMVVIPDISQQTLTSVLRGRVEELTGWAFLLQNEPAQATLRFRRGLTVLPEKSVWWRTSLWRLGNALEADKKPKEAIESYIRAYDQDNPDPEKYFYIEKLFGSTYGTVNGLESRIGTRPAQQVTEAEAPVAEPSPTPSISDKSSTQTAQKMPDAVPFASVDGKANPSAVKLPENVPAVIKADEPPPKETSNPKNAAPDAFDDVDGDAAAKKLEGATKIGAARKVPVMKPIKSLPALPEVSTVTLPMPDAARSTGGFEPSLVIGPDDADFSSGAPPRIQLKSSPSSSPSTPPASKETVKTPEQPKPNSADPNTPGRARVVNKPSESQTGGCSIVPTRDSVTIFPNVGLWGVLVELKGGDLNQLSATSEKPEDVSVKREPSPEGETRAFFAIRSISPNTGDFKITFSAPCGKKEVVVSVRGL